ncbi:MAG: hypothetical protein ACXW1Z_21620 [Methylobacter sp.]
MMQIKATRDYKQIQQKIENLDDVELIEVINFIDFLQHKRAHKQRRLAIFAELRTKDVAKKFGDPLAWQKEMRQDKPLEGRK